MSLKCYQLTKYIGKQSVNMNNLCIFVAVKYKRRMLMENSIKNKHFKCNIQRAIWVIYKRKPININSSVNR